MNCLGSVAVLPPSQGNMPAGCTRTDAQWTDDEAVASAGKAPKCASLLDFGLGRCVPFVANIRSIENGAMGKPEMALIVL